MVLNLIVFVCVLSLVYCGVGAEEENAPRFRRPRPVHIQHDETPSDQTCGRPIIQPSTRIIGGQEAIAHSWPWQISLRYRGSHTCGGSIISRYHVMTAAHCVARSQSPNDYQVVIGMHDRRSLDKQITAISNIQIHPYFLPYSHDVAIITLSNAITFTSTVMPVCLPERDVAEGTVCEITGWGNTHGTGDNRYLLQTKSPIIPRSVCNDRDHYRGRIDDTMICAGTATSHSCNGDSGGPLICQRPDGAWEQQGIVSWGTPDCGERGEPGVYTRVVSVLSWIRRVINTRK